MPDSLAEGMIALVALQHLGFMILEMFFWDRPLGLRVFGHSRERATVTRVLAANQGLYNGFLAAGLLWGLTPLTPTANTSIFFLVCVILAGVYGGISVHLKILWVQALPAAIALGLVLWS